MVILVSNLSRQIYGLSNENAYVRALVLFELSLGQEPLPKIDISRTI